MAALATYKRRPVAPTKNTQKVEIGTLTSLHEEKTIEEYHTLFLNIELLMTSMIDHGLQDEVITMINTARIAQYAKDISSLDKYLLEIVASATRWNEENDRVSLRAETERYSPEATVRRLNDSGNPIKLTPPETGIITTLTITARLTNTLPLSSASMLRAEQVYGPFWNIKARCFVVPKGTVAGAAALFLDYLAANKKAKKRDYRLLAEYKLSQSVYRNVDIYMLVDVPRLIALRDTKIIELGIASKHQIEVQSLEERLPIIERAEAIVAKLPTIVSSDSRRFMINRLVEFMLLDEKRTRLRKARYARDGEPKASNPASVYLASERFRIARDMAEKIGATSQEIYLALSNKTLSSYAGRFIRIVGVTGWETVRAQAKEWHKLMRLLDG